MDVVVKLHIRQKLEEKLRRRIPDPIWQDLEADGFVDDARSRGGMADLTGAARRYLRYVDLGARGGAERREPTVSGHANIAARARALAAIVAQEMEATSRVASIRRFWWGGGRLGRQEAIDLASTPALSLLDIGLLQRVIGTPRGHIDVRGMESRVVSSIDEAIDGHPGRRWAIELTTGSGVRVVENWVADSAVELVTFAVSRGEAIHVAAMSQSVVGRVAYVARELARRAPWTEQHAAWFTLTGDPPSIPPILYGVARHADQTYRRAVVRLEIEPWVPHDAVLAAYAQAQAEVLSSANRALGERSAELARFAAGDAGRLSVAAAMRLWNTTYPQWAEHDRRNFQRAANQARRLVASPRWRALSYPRGS
jgi:hypothetical protein